MFKKSKKEYNDNEVLIEKHLTAVDRIEELLLYLQYLSTDRGKDNFIEIVKCSQVSICHQGFDSQPKTHRRSPCIVLRDRILVLKTCLQTGCSRHVNFIFYRRSPSQDGQPSPFIETVSEVLRLLGQEAR